MLQGPSNQTLSKFLSLILRHKPETIGITLDENGWADVATLLAKCADKEMPMTREQLQQIVDGNEKKRFAFSEDGSRIRASQGHSLSVDLQLEPKEPPAILFHGTTIRNLESIRARGLLKGERQQVHLSSDATTAKEVGSRHGQPVVLEVAAAALHAAGHAFYLSENGVWLTDFVPAQFLNLPDP